MEILVQPFDVMPLDIMPRICDEEGGGGGDFPCYRSCPVCIHES